MTTKILDRFLAARHLPDDCLWRLIGLPYDAASSYRRGAQHGPAEIRRASDSIESYSSYSQRDLENIAFFDEGDLNLAGKSPDTAVQIIREHYAEKTRQGLRLFGLGGDHAVTIGATLGLNDAGLKPTVLYLDAHLDLRNDYDGTPYSHASVARRLTELWGIEHLVQWGMRSGEKEEYNWAKPRSTFIGNDPIELRKTCIRLHAQPVYLTLDLDLFDPSELPGVGNPEPGGLKFTDFLALLPALNKLNVLGVDIVELAPVWDLSERSSVMAAEIIRELLLTVIK